MSTATGLKVRGAGRRGLEGWSAGWDRAKDGDIAAGHDVAGGGKEEILGFWRGAGLRGGCRVSARC
jgi:hypothetical protein